MSTEKETLTQQSLDDFYNAIEGADSTDVSDKIKYLKTSQPLNGLGIARWPSGTVISVLQKVNHRIKDESLENDYYFIKTTHSSAFLLVKKGTYWYAKCIDERAKTGGMNSTDVVDLGEFLIVEVCDSSIVGGEAFSLYKVADDFMD